jgi:serine/threonine-protein kinase
VNSDRVRTSETPDPLVGRILEGRYRVLHCIGKGGMGAVYLAQHVLIGRKVAIKALHPALASSAETVARFHREALAAASVGNEHVVDVTDMGQLDSGAYYIVLEYLEGADLGWTVASEGRLSIRRSLAIAVQLCDALSAVHAAGIVHRDLKPENLFLVQRETQPDFLKVLDFGVCKFHDVGLLDGLDDKGKGKRLTATGGLIGTPQYMAPEQIEVGGPIDPRADLYAVGAILHFALTGEPPFDALTLPQLFSSICQTPAPRLSAARPDVSPELDRLVQRALAKRPEQRFADAAQLRAALLPLLAAAEEHSAQQVSAARPRRARLSRSGVRPSVHAAQPVSGSRARSATRPSDAALARARGQAAAGHSGLAADAASSPARVGLRVRPITLPGRQHWPLRLCVMALVVGVFAGIAHWSAQAPRADTLSHGRGSSRAPAPVPLAVDSQAQPTRPATAAPRDRVDVAAVDVAAVDVAAVDVAAVDVAAVDVAADAALRHGAEAGGDVAPAIRADAALGGAAPQPAKAAAAARRAPGNSRGPHARLRAGIAESLAQTGPQAASDAPLAAASPVTHTEPAQLAPVPGDVPAPAPSSDPKPASDARSGVSGRELKRVF